jgi:hypothetical protein
MLSVSRYPALRKASNLLSQFLEVGLLLHILSRYGFLDFFAVSLQDTLSYLLSFGAEDKGLKYLLSEYLHLLINYFANISICSCIAVILAI